MKSVVQDIFEQDLTKTQSEYIVRTLKDISRNSSFAERKECHEFPTESVMTAIDFDHIKTIYVNTLGNVSGKQLSFRSCDALYPTDTGEWYFVEFKDGETDAKVIREVREKIEDSKNILMDLGILETGYLQVDDMKSVLLPTQSGQMDFGFDTRMKKLKFESQLNYFRNHFYFILVYNEALYKETELDGEGFRNELENGKYSNEINFLESHSYLLKNRSAKEFLYQIINEKHFLQLIEMIKKASEIGSAEERKLIEHFETDISDRMELLNRCGAVKGKLGTQDDINGMTGEEFLKALYIFSVYSKNVQKELKKLSQIIDLKAQKYEDFKEKLKAFGMMPDEYRDDIDSYIRMLIFKGKFENEYETLMNNGNCYLKLLIGAMAENSKIPKRLFSLYRYEGKYFKEVYTYSEAEFHEFFVKKFEKEETA